MFCKILKIRSRDKVELNNLNTKCNSESVTELIGGAKKNFVAAACLRLFEN